MCIPQGFYQGNRSEYLAIPALSKLGFTVPVPRQEDHFGVDFIVHLAKVVDNVVSPTGRAFGIQIKSNKKDQLVFDKQSKRDCLYDSSLPFFLGVVSHEDLRLSVYNTLNRLCFLWGPGKEKGFSLIVDDKEDGIPEPDFKNRTCGTGKPILEIDISEPGTPRERRDEIEVLQSTMESWIDLENENLSLKEQRIALVFWPSTYATNKPLEEDTELPEGSRKCCTKFARRDDLPHVCRATEKALTSLLFYLDKDRLPRDDAPAEVVRQMDKMFSNAKSLRDECKALRSKKVDTGPSASPSSSFG